jgi:hypothetical protein
MGSKRQFVDSLFLQAIFLEVEAAASGHWQLEVTGSMKGKRFCRD